MKISDSLTLWAGGVLEVVLVLDVSHAEVSLHLEAEGRPVRDQLGPLQKVV